MSLDMQSLVTYAKRLLLLFGFLLLPYYSLFAEGNEIGDKSKASLEKWLSEIPGTPGPAIITTRFPIEVMSWTIFLGGIFFILSFRYQKFRWILRILSGIIGIFWIIYITISFYNY